MESKSCTTKTLSDNDYLRLARELAMEEVCGCDAFTREDIHRLIAERGFDKDRLFKLAVEENLKMSQPVIEHRMHGWIYGD